MGDGFDYGAARQAVFGLRNDGGRVICIPQNIPALGRLVLLALVEHAPKIEPSIARLVDMTGLSERAVRNQLRDLEARGVIVTTERRGTRSTYALNLPNPGTSCPPAPDAPRHEMPPTPAPDAGVPRHVVPPTPARRAPEADKEADKRSRKVSRRKASTGKRSAPVPLPADWTPTPEHHERAAAARLNVDHEADKFRAHAASNGRTAVCWNAAFTTWLLKAVEFGAQRRGVARAPTNTTGPIQPDRNGTPVFGDKHGFKSPSPSPASA